MATKGKDAEASSMAEESPTQLRKRGGQKKVCRQRNKPHRCHSAVVFSQKSPEKKEDKNTSATLSDTSLPKIVHAKTESGYQRVRLVPRTDGKEGYYVIPVWQPTMWFPKSTERPFWSYTVEVNPMYWVLIACAFLLRFWKIDFPPYVMWESCDQWFYCTVTRGGTTRVVQYGAIDHVPSYYLSRGIVLFFPHIVPPLTVALHLFISSSSFPPFFLF